MDTIKAGNKSKESKGPKFIRAIALARRLPPRKKICPTCGTIITGGCMCQNCGHKTCGEY